MCDFAGYEYVNSSAQREQIVPMRVDNGDIMSVATEPLGRAPLLRMVNGNDHALMNSPMNFDNSSSNNMRISEAIYSTNHIHRN